jgi:hypothetical protein
MLHSNGTDIIFLKLHSVNSLFEDGGRLAADTSGDVQISFSFLVAAESNGKQEINVLLK